MLLPYFHKAKMTPYTAPQTMYIKEPETEETKETEKTDEDKIK